MLRWILGILLVLALVVAGSCWLGYRELTSKGPTAAVNVTVTPEVAWTYLILPDSIRVWQDSSTQVFFSRDSALVVGDTVRVTERPGPGGRADELRWVLRRAEPNTLLEWRTAETDSEGGTLVRVDSLVAVGDSLRISSTFSVPGIDSMKGSDSIGRVGRGALSMTGKLLVGAMRLVAQADLDRLKVRVQ